MMNHLKKKFFVVGMIVILTLALVACGEKKAKEVTAPAETVKEDVNQTIEAFAKVKIREEKVLKLDFPATVEEINVTEGEQVKQGDILINLDLTEINHKLENKKRLLEVARKELVSITEKSDINLKKLKIELKTEEFLYQKDKAKLIKKEDELKEESSVDIKKLSSQISLAQKSYNRAERELADKKKLLSVAAISQYEFDSFEKQFEQEGQKLLNLQLSLEELKDNKEEKIEELEKSLELRKEKIDTLKLSSEEGKIVADEKYLAKENEIKSLESEVELLARKLFAKSYLKGNQIVVDIDKAIVDNLSVIEGDLLGQSTVTLLNLMDLSKIVAEAEVPEEFIKDLKLGAAAKIIPLADSEKEYHGKVIRISDMAIKSGGETIVLVDISIDDYDGFLLPNFNVDVEIDK